MEERTLKEIIEDTRKLFMNDFSGHDFSHTMRVYRTALELCEREKGNIEIVSLAALLHDADDYKLSRKTYENKNNAVSIMRKYGIEENVINRVVEIIEQVSFVGKDSVVPDSIEGKCVQDADRLDALGAIGIARALTYGGNHNRVLYDPEIKPRMDMDREEYRNHVSTTINHFYEKLFLLKDMMNTDSGKRVAVQREMFMREYLDEFYREWDGKDISD